MWLHDSCISLEFFKHNEDSNARLKINPAPDFIYPFKKVKKKRLFDRQLNQTNHQQIKIWQRNNNRI